MFLVFWTIGSFLFTFASLGQTQSINGNFQVAQAVGCAPFTVTPEVLFTGNTSLIAYKFENTLNPEDCSLDYQTNPDECTNTNFKDITSYEYTEPGTYYLFQLIRPTGGRTIFDFIEITVLPRDIPIFDVSLCRNNEVALTFDFGADSYDFYEIDFGDGRPSQIKRKDDPNDTTFPYSYLSQGTYPIIVSGKLDDGNDTRCGVAPPVTVNTLNDFPVPNILSLESTTENSLRLTYEALNPYIDYQLQLMNTSGVFEDLENIDPVQHPTELTITNNSFDNLNESYTFRLVASDPCGSEEPSNQASSIGLDYQLVDITNSINVTYSWNTNELTTPMEFIQNGAPIFTTTDRMGSSNQNYVDCTNLGPFYMEKTIGSVVVQSITITPFENENLDLPAPEAPDGALIDNNIELTFTSPPFVFDQIEVFRKDGSGSFSSIGSSSTLSFTDFGVSGNLSEACYLIRYTDACGNQSLASSETCIPLEGLLRLPNAFSPNGDRVNDTFDVGSGVFTDFQILIFNKWGILVYKGNDPTKGWDGNVSGKQAPTGTYQYRISYLNNGTKLITTGTVTLIR